ncbi:hypothetical protein RAA17_05850 [Komagataeibacter rhaeticus]|nr:hypothetical protein [Komagataeibacter rhaeticus]
MPVQEAHRAAQIMTTIGMTVTCDILPGVGHTLTASGVTRVQEFILPLLLPGSFAS